MENLGVRRPVVGSIAWLGVMSAARLKPSLKGSLALPRWATSDDALYTDVLVQIGPMNPFAATDKPEVAALLYGSVHEARIPSQGNGNRTTIGQLDAERISADLDSCRSERSGIKNQSSHASSARVARDAE